MVLVVAAGCFVIAIALLAAVVAGARGRFALSLLLGLSPFAWRGESLLRATGAAGSRWLLPSHLRGPLDGRRLSRRHGRVYYVWHELEPVVMLADAGVIAAFYRDQFLHARGHEMVVCGPVFAALLGHCTATVSGSRAVVHRVRRCYEHYFSRRFLEETVAPLLLPAALEQTLGTVARGVAVPYAQLHLDRIHLRVVAAIIYGPTLAAALFPDLLRFVELQRRLFGHMMEPTAALVKEAREFSSALEAFHRTLEQQDEPPGMFFALAADVAAGTSPLTFREIVHTINEILLTNSDVTALSLGFLLTDLARNPRVVETLRGHALSPDDSPTDAFETYAAAVIKESARMHPLVEFSFPERSASDLPIPGGVVIPAGTVVCVDAVSLSFDPAMWPEPEQFRPERFVRQGSHSLSPSASRAPDAPVEAAAASEHRLFLHFGLGPRKCQGLELARLFSTEFLRHVVLAFNLAQPTHPPEVHEFPARAPFFTCKFPEPVLLLDRN